MGLWQQSWLQIVSRKLCLYLSIMGVRGIKLFAENSWTIDAVSHYYFLSKIIITSWTVLKSNPKSGWPSSKWWVTPLGKVITVPSPFYCCLLTILRMVCNHTFGWQFTILGMVFDHPGDGWWPSYGKWVTIFGKVSDHNSDVGWPSLGWLVTILVL